MTKVANTRKQSQFNIQNSIKKETTNTHIYRIKTTLTQFKPIHDKNFQQTWNRQTS